MINVIYNKSYGSYRYFNCKKYINKPFKELLLFQFCNKDMSFKLKNLLDFETTSLYFSLELAF